MVNKSLLQSKMVLKGLSMSDLADAIGCSKASLSYKVNNKRPFFDYEMRSVVDALGLSCAEASDVFCLGAMSTDNRL